MQSQSRDVEYKYGALDDIVNLYGVSGGQVDHLVVSRLKMYRF